MNEKPGHTSGSALLATRRDVLAGSAGFLAAIAGLSLLSPNARAADAPRPHILYILADDLGFARASVTPRESSRRRAFGGASIARGRRRATRGRRSSRR